MPEMMPDWLEVFETEKARYPTVVCQECKGEGWIIVNPPDSNGKQEIDRCPVCGGNGFVYEDVHAQI